MFVLAGPDPEPKTVETAKGSGRVEDPLPGTGLIKKGGTLGPVGLITGVGEAARSTPTGDLEI